MTATLEQIDIVHRMIRKYPETFELALTAADIERIHKEARLLRSSGWRADIRSTTPSRTCACSTGSARVHDPHPLEQHAVGGLGTDTPKINGLSPFGEEVVREMNWLGMLVDLSHVSPDTMDGRDPRDAGAGDLLAFGRPGIERPRAQRARQHPADAAGQRRCRHGHVRARLRLAEGQRLEQAADRRTGRRRRRTRTTPRR